MNDECGVRSAECGMGNRKFLDALRVASFAGNWVTFAGGGDVSFQLRRGFVRGGGEFLCLVRGRVAGFFVRTRHEFQTRGGLSPKTLS